MPITYDTVYFNTKFLHVFGVTTLNIKADTMTIESHKLCHKLATLINCTNNLASYVKWLQYMTTAVLILVLPGAVRLLSQPGPAQEPLPPPVSLPRSPADDTRGGGGGGSRGRGGRGGI